MKKLLYARDSEEFWKIFNEEREKRRQKLAKLPFARKIEILEKMQADMTLTRESTGRYKLSGGQKAGKKRERK